MGPPVPECKGPPEQRVKTILGPSCKNQETRGLQGHTQLPAGRGVRVSGPPGREKKGKKNGPLQFSSPGIQATTHFPGQAKTPSGRGPRTVNEPLPQRTRSWGLLLPPWTRRQCRSSRQPFSVASQVFITWRVYVAKLCWFF